MEEKIISMLENIIEMQKNYQKKNDKDVQELKDDMSELRTELKGDIANLRTELKDDMSKLRTELKGDITELRTELKGDIAELKQDMTEVKSDVATLKIDTATLRKDVATLKTQRMIDTNNLALVINRQTKMMKILEDIYGNTKELNYVM